MSIKRVSIAELQTIVSCLDEPVIVEKFADSLPNFPELINALSLDSLIALNSTDIIGFSTESKVEETELTDALKQLKIGTPGYINGWEYLAGDIGSLTLGPLVSSIENFFSSDSFLTSLNIPSANLLDSVMKWIFISQGPGSYSDCHADPIGSAAWMLMVHGRKQWFIEDKQGIISPGDLILIPPGMKHRVENLGTEYNVAISHNWIPRNATKLMWIELQTGLEKLDSMISTSSLTLSDFHDSQTVDNLLFGLIMIVLHAEIDQRETMLMSISDDSQRRYINELVKKLES